MAVYNTYEDRYTSAYCRLNFEIWHPGYRDDISKYLEDYPSLDRTFGRVKTALSATNIVHVDGSLCLKKYDMKECVKSFLNFLYTYEEFEMIVAFPYNKLKEADAFSYLQTNHLIENMKIIDEINEKDYMFMVWNIEHNSQRYLKVMPDKTVIFAIKQSNDNTKRGSFELGTELFDELIQWSKSQINKHKKVEISEGISLTRTEKFQVEFNFDALGYDKKEWDFTGIGFNKLDEEGVMAIFLKMSELNAFMEGVEEWEWIF